MFGNITRAVLRFEEPAWAAISPSAIELVRALLRADPKRRISASAVLRHEWMTEGMKVRDRWISRSPQPFGMRYRH